MPLTTKDGTAHELASGSVERIQEEMLSCVFNERGALYSQVRLPSAANQGSRLRSSSILDAFVLLRAHVVHLI